MTVYIVIKGKSNKLWASGCDVAGLYDDPNLAEEKRQHLVSSGSKGYDLAWVSKVELYNPFPLPDVKPVHHKGHAKANIKN